MTGKIKIGLAVTGVVAMLPIVGAILLFIGMSQFTPAPVPRREIILADHGTLIIDGNRQGRSEHGFSQRAGYRPAGATETEWFGELSDGYEPRFYSSGPLVVVIDLPGACLFVRNANNQDKWKNFALVFPNDLGPSPMSYYAKANGLTIEEVSRINELGGMRERKYPTTYIEDFDPVTRDLKCSYHVDNISSWPLHLRLSEEGTRLALIGIGDSSP